MTQVRGLGALRDAWVDDAGELDFSVAFLSDGQRSVVFDRGKSTPLPGPTLPARPPTPDQATLERLRALGYVP